MHQAQCKPFHNQGTFINNPPNNILNYQNFNFNTNYIINQKCLNNNLSYENKNKINKLNNQCFNDHITNNSNKIYNHKVLPMQTFNNEKNHVLKKLFNVFECE